MFLEFEELVILLIDIHLDSFQHADLHLAVLELVSKLAYQVTLLLKRLVPLELITAFWVD